MASASLPRGNTLVVAEMIHRLVGGDQFQIVTETPYPSLYRDTTDRALKEQQKKARPQLKTHLKSLGDYDVIFLGYPDWWGTLPMAVMTFLEEYDFAGMTSLLPVLMAYSFTGNAFHAVLGALLFVFFVTHLALNLNWFLTVLAGRKSIEPWLRVAVNLDLIVIALMVVLGLSAVPISQTLLGFLHLPEIPEGRKIHVGLATWGFLLMAVHLGLHVTTLKARFGGGFGPWGPTRLWALGAIVLVCGVGARALAVQEIGPKLLFYYSFSFWDPDAPPILLVVDYLAILTLVATASHGLVALVHHQIQRQRRSYEGTDFRGLR